MAIDDETDSVEEDIAFRDLNGLTSGNLGFAGSFSNVFKELAFCVVNLSWLQITSVNGPGKQSLYGIDPERFPNIQSQLFGGGQIGLQYLRLPRYGLVDVRQSVITFLQAQDCFKRGVRSRDLCPYVLSQACYLVFCRVFSCLDDVTKNDAFHERAELRSHTECRAESGNTELGSLRIFLGFFFFDCKHSISQC